MIEYRLVFDRLLKRWTRRWVHKYAEQQHGNANQTCSRAFKDKRKIHNVAAFVNSSAYGNADPQWRSIFLAANVFPVIAVAQQKDDSATEDISWDSRTDSTLAPSKDTTPHNQGVNRETDKPVADSSLTQVGSPPDRQKLMAVNTTASLLSAVICAAVLHPLDLIKTRMQVKNSAGGAMSGIGNGTIDSVFRIWQREGIAGLYKGCVATIIGSGLSWGIFRFLYDCFRLQFICDDDAEHPMKSAPTHNVDDPSTTAKPRNYGISPLLSHSSFGLNLAGSLFSSYVATLLVHPLWMVKARLEMQSVESKALGWVQYTSWRNCVWVIFSAEGPKAFYKGLGPALALAPHGAIHMVVYEELKRWSFGNDFFLKATGVLKTSWGWFMLSSEKEGADGSPVDGGPYVYKPSLLPFLWGSTSKLLAILLTYPLQSVRSLQQMIASPYASKGLFYIVSTLSRAHGVTALYRGVSVHIQRSCLQNGLIFLFYENFTHRNC